ncbi:MAG TPA: phosphotransferase [Streptosporangiaceae bacterium]|jgi:Ser/Thr protein kinase RdoA (MazF antagonist)
MVSGTRLETPAGLLARWGIPADADLTRAERGSSNQTFTVAHRGRRWVLRISQNLSADQARAEHRLLGRLRAAGLPFGVPEPVAALGGDTVAELARALRGTGVPTARIRRLEAAAEQVRAQARATVTDLPVQVVHGDLGASNALVDERTGEISGVLDFELAGPDARVQDLLVGLLLSGALAGPGWACRAAALVRGYAAVLSLGQAEITAVPDLLVVRCVASVFWRAGRWRRGQSVLSDVADRVAVLEASQTWLAVHRGRLLSVLAAAGQ